MYVGTYVYRYVCTYVCKYLRVVVVGVGGLTFEEQNHTIYLPTPIRPSAS